jgi:hypothetical protein
MAEFLNIDNLLGEPKNRVKKVSVELEGGWSVVPPGVALERDGSVFQDNHPVGYRCGELPVGPYQPAAIPKILKKYYPQLVDRTCGMHIHMSFATLRHYQWLMEEEYQETILEYLSRWAKEEAFPKNHHIWERLSGESVYCQKQFWPDEQVGWKGRKDHDQHRHGHRYTVVHYCGRLNTIEIRVLPMMKEVDQAIRAVNEVINITNASLVLLSKRDKGSKSDLVVKDRIEVFEDFDDDVLLVSPNELKRMKG